MDGVILKHYTLLLQFLNRTFGPDYELVLHDLTTPNGSIVAIANGHISGRTLGDSLIGPIRDVLKSDPDPSDNFLFHDCVVLPNGKILRTCALYIRNSENKVVGLLCVNFDHSRYQAMAKNLFQLCHPSAFLDKYLSSLQDAFSDSELIKAYVESNVSSNSYLQSPIEGIPKKPLSLSELVLLTAKELTGKTSLDRLSSDERRRIVGALDKQNTFKVKGALKTISTLLDCSPSTIYRYISECKNDPS